MAANWKDIYNEKINELTAGNYGTQEQSLRDAYNNQVSALDAQRNATEKKLTDTRDESLRQAYITKMQSQRDMPSLMAAQGLGGGATETSVANILRSYQSGRNAANKQYSGDLTTLETNHATNKNTLGSDLNTKLADLQAAKRVEALSLAQFAYQAAKAEEEAEAERQRQAAASRSYSSGGSRTSPSASSNTSRPGAKGYGGYISPYAEQENAKKLAKLSTNPYGQLEKDKYYATHSLRGHKENRYF